MRQTWRRLTASIMAILIIMTAAIIPEISHQLSAVGGTTGGATGGAGAGTGGGGGGGTGGALTTNVADRPLTFMV